MKLSEAIIEAMNDIDESLLEGSEVIERESIFSKKGWLILTSMVVALVIMLPMISNMFRMGSTNDAMPSEAITTEEAIEENENGVVMEESTDYKSESVIVPEVMYAEDLLEIANNTKEEMILVEISASNEKGEKLSLEELEALAEELKEKGYGVEEVNNDYILVYVNKEEILNMNIYIYKSYVIYVESHN